jgi:hypothetical protein
MKRMFLVLMALFLTALWSLAIPADMALQLATFKVQHLYPQLEIAGTGQITNSQHELLAYVYHLSPTGYMVIGAKEELPPLVAFSGSSAFGTISPDNPLLDIITADLSYRLQYEPEAERNREAWQSAFQSHREDQWPPVGYSTTEGWIKTLWTQTAPFNWFCPLDPVTSIRSLAGCPAIAMGQIVNYHRALNGTRLNDTDDYYHQYSGRNYWVDNDFATLDFPSYPQLNTYLDEINYRYRYQQDLNDSLDAAIVFAVGSALKQVYTSSGSGTFSVTQPYDAFRRFGFAQSQVLTENSPNLYWTISFNVKNAQPVLLAVVTPSWNSGHNLVVDGYRSDNYFHINFGHGGAYNGWILLPTQMPLGMTVVEGAIVNIKPIDYVIASPDTLDFSLAPYQVLEVYNFRSNSVVVEELLLGAGLNSEEWSVVPLQPLPYTIPGYEMMSIGISYNNNSQVTSMDGNLRLILNNAAVDVPVRYREPTSLDDQNTVPGLGVVTVYPNPFSHSCKIKPDSKIQHKLKLEVFNIKGQKLYSEELLPGSQTPEFTWIGTDSKGIAQASGLYLYRISDANKVVTGKLLKLK